MSTEETDSGKISHRYQQRDLPKKLTHDHARSGKCGFSLRLISWLRSVGVRSDATCVWEGDVDTI